ncbi:hypothetical protein [Flectobacillus major]|uniref:hypothetical protein n=1 Tax=Flectobacillus major TaxID=103 RepID=UPI0005C76C7B|nr:hypothetical protein [Flectobacillus major]
MSILEPSENKLSNNKPILYSDQLSLYDEYGALAYGIILQIIPQEQLAQEVLVDLFSSSSLQQCNENVVSKTICIIRNARAKAIAWKSKLAAVSAANDYTTSGKTLPEIVFDLSFKQGISTEVIAEKLNVSKERVLKAINEYFKIYRQS